MLIKQGKNVTKTEKKVVLCKPTPLNDYRDLKMFTGIYSDSQGKSLTSGPPPEVKLLY